MSLKLAVLGFLALAPTSGYTLKQRFDGSVRSFWTATQSQIYRELHQLERDGLVTVERARGDGKPDRKLYLITAAGRQSLAQWLVEAPEPLTLRHPLLLKFVFAAGLPAAGLDAMLARYAEGVTATRAEYTARLEMRQILSLARTARERRMWQLAIEHGIAWCDMELAWLAQARRDLMPKRKEAKLWNRKTR